MNNGNYFIRLIVRTVVVVGTIALIIHDHHFGWILPAMYFLILYE